MADHKDFSLCSELISQYDKSVVNKTSKVAYGDSNEMTAISEHIKQYVGKIEDVCHEIVSDIVHIDVHHVKPTPERNVHTLITTGMSSLPMTCPAGAEELAFAELLVTLPADWPFDEESFQDDSYYWPIKQLKCLARWPHRYQTWLSWGHTVPNGDPAQAFAENTSLCGMILAAPSTLPEAFYQLQLSPQKKLWFYSIIPVYQEEMDYQLRAGTEALFEQFNQLGINEIIDIDRQNVA